VKSAGHSGQLPGGLGNLGIVPLAGSDELRQTPDIHSNRRSIRSNRSSGSWSSSYARGQLRESSFIRRVELVFRKGRRHVRARTGTVSPAPVLFQSKTTACARPGKLVQRPWWNVREEEAEGDCPINGEYQRF